MKASRCVLLGFVIAALGICVWWYARPAPELFDLPVSRRAPVAQSNDPSPNPLTEPIAPTKPVLVAPKTPAFADTPASRDIQTVLAENNRFERRHALERLGYDAGANGFAATKEMLATIENAADRAAFLRGVFSRMAEGSPADALLAVKETTRGDERDAAIGALVASWEIEVSLETRRDLLALNDGGRELGQFGRLLGNPALAAEAARLALEGPDQMHLLRMAAVATVDTDPHEALLLAQELQGEDRTMLLHTIARAWGRRNADEAMAWALSEPDPAKRAQLQAQVVTGWSWRDPASAAVRLGEIQDPALRQEVAQNLAASWAITDTQAALMWARGLPDAQQRDSAVTAIQSNAPVGIGVSLRTSSNGLPMIDHLIPGSPAGASGALKPGYEIAAIRDERGGFTDLRGKKLDEVTKLIRGKPGTVAVLQVIPDGGNFNQRLTITIPRQQLMFKQPPATP